MFHFEHSTINWARSKGIRKQFVLMFPNSRFTLKDYFATLSASQKYVRVFFFQQCNAWYIWRSMLNKPRKYNTKGKKYPLAPWSGWKYQHISYTWCFSLTTWPHLATITWTGYQTGWSELFLGPQTKAFENHIIYKLVSTSTSN